MSILAILAPVGLGYLLGSIPFGLLLTRLGGAGDIRSIGSGNIGATNVLRTGRKDLAAATLALDGLKAWFAVWLAACLLGPAAMPFAAVAAVVGHIFPIWLRFRGGKGVASGLGAMIALSWPVGLVGCAVWLLMALVLRISSAAALTAFVLMPVMAALLAGGRLALPALLISALIIARHHANITRLLSGTEPVIGR